MPKGGIVRDNLRALKNPEGIPAISRGFREATPPESGQYLADPEGVAALTAVDRIAPISNTAATPSGSFHNRPFPVVSLRSTTG